jgi:hypothetical protein
MPVAATMRGFLSLEAITNTFFVSYDTIVCSLPTKPDTYTFHFKKRRLLQVKNKKTPCTTLSNITRWQWHQHIQHQPLITRVAESATYRLADQLSSCHGGPPAPTDKATKKSSVCARKFRHKKRTEAERSFSRRGLFLYLVAMVGRLHK